MFNEHEDYIEVEETTEELSLEDKKKLSKSEQKELNKLRSNLKKYKKQFKKACQFSIISSSCNCYCYNHIIYSMLD